jgi:hypothetical protein
VATGGNRWHLVAVRSHFGLRLDGRNNPARAYNRPGRRISASSLQALLLTQERLSMGFFRQDSLYLRQNITCVLQHIFLPFISELIAALLLIHEACNGIFQHSYLLQIIACLLQRFY